MHIYACNISWTPEATHIYNPSGQKFSLQILFDRKYPKIVPHQLVVNAHLFLKQSPRPSVRS